MVHTDDVIPVFQVGDRVIARDDISKTGTVVAFLDGFVGVRHDEYAPERHNIPGHCENGYGWWYFPSALTDLSELNEFEESDVSFSSLFGGDY